MTIKKTGNGGTYKMGYADKKIQSCLSTCKTTKDWKNAVDFISKDLKDEIEAERGLESYIIESLGFEALGKFLDGIEEPLLEVDLIDTYRVDFGSDIEDTDLHRCNFLYVAHLYRMTESRGDKLKKNIESLLGEEAYTRLCYRGDYDNEVLFQDKVRQLDSEDKKIKLLLDYLTGRGVFSDGE